MARRFLTTLVLILATSPVAEAQDLFLTNGQIVDPETQQIRSGNLLIVGGKIAGSPDQAPPNFAGRTVDLAGKWVIPGLNDLHTHSYGNMAPGDAFDAPGTATVAKRMLYAGVTAFLDLFGDEDKLYQLRQQQRSGAVDGADLFASLSCLTATKGHCTEYGVATRVMDTPEDAKSVVADLAKKKPDVVKIVYAPTGNMPSIDKATLAAAVATASDNGIKTIIHINTWQDARDAVEVGASAITHVPGREPIPADLPGLMAERGVYSIPTLAVETDMGAFIKEPEVLAAPMATQLTTDAIIAAYRSDEIRQHAAGHEQDVARRNAMILASVKAMADGGVKILTGTDSGNWGTIQGYSLHRELLKLVQAGLTPWQALAASTTEAGRFLGRPYGVDSGDEANLLVLERSPIEDIRNTQRIAMVIHHGMIVDREELLTATSPRAQ